ncbi:MAG: chromate efflux transporter [Acidimicrobiia bacterium]|nr:MAG: chromate efflux transporter [Acidimicrobiia bacterium]
MQAEASEASGPGRLAELVRLFGRLGVTAFGGPAAHIAMMHDEVVIRRRWIDDQHFVDMIGVTNLIPGPNSTEMAMHVGRHRAGWRGLIVAGASFILPAAAIVLAFAWVYVRHGSTPTGEALLYGVKPVVIVIVLQALLKLGRTAVKGWLTGLVAIGGAAGYLVGIDEVLLLAAGALFVLASRATPGPGSLVLLPVASGGWVSAPALADTASLGTIILVFLKAGAFLFGSGYVLFAFLQGDLVDRLGLLTEQQLLDAVAVGQFTPGPVFTTATFIGYLLAGLPGAGVATLAIFLPAFLFVGLMAPLVRRARDRVWTAALLDGVNAVAVGLMGAVTVVLVGDAVVDAVSMVVAAVAGLILWRTRLNSAWLLMGAGIAGLIAGAAGWSPG